MANHIFRPGEMTPTGVHTHVLKAMDIESSKRVTIHVMAELRSPHNVRRSLKRRTGKLREVGSKIFVPRKSPNMNPVY